MKSTMLILLATAALASFAIVLTTQNVLAFNDKNSEVVNTHKHEEKNCNDNCEGNSGSTINNEDSHFNENCNTHRADSANDDDSEDCKDKSHNKPAS